MKKFILYFFFVLLSLYPDVSEPVDFKFEDTWKCRKINNVQYFYGIEFFEVNKKEFIYKDSYDNYGFAYKIKKNLFIKYLLFEDGTIHLFYWIVKPLRLNYIAIMSNEEVKFKCKRKKFLPEKKNNSTNIENNENMG